MKTPSNQISNLKPAGFRSAKHLGSGDAKRQLPRIDLEARKRNKALSAHRILDILRTQAPDFWRRAELVGKWVWIEYKDRQPAKITAALSEYGFHWNRRRRLWQHPGGTALPRSPRERFGSVFPADHQQPS